MLSLLTTINCNKYQELADAEYPDQLIYMPTAGTLYLVSEPANTWDTPTTGNPYRYRVEENTNKVIVPLGVSRGGINYNGSVSIEITHANDTVSSLINDGLDALLLPQSVYSIPSSITLLDGKSSVTFDMIIDKNFLLNEIGKTYAMGVSITSNDRKINPNKKTTIVVFDTNLLIE